MSAPKRRRAWRDPVVLLAAAGGALSADRLRLSAALAAGEELQRPDGPDARSPTSPS